MSSVALTIDQDVWRPQFNPWLIAVVVALAAFMEGARYQYCRTLHCHIWPATWARATSKHVGADFVSGFLNFAIVLPISGWLAGAFGRKRFFMTCLGVFTVSSLLCAVAPSLGLLLLFRVLQGAGRRRPAN